MCESHYWKATFCGGRYLIGPSEAEMHVNYEAVALKHVFCNADTTTFTSLNCCILPNCIPHSTLCKESVQKWTLESFFSLVGGIQLDHHVPCWNVNPIILQLLNVDWCMIVHWILWPTICTLGESEIEGGWPVLERKFNTNILKTNSPKHTRKD